MDTRNLFTFFKDFDLNHISGFYMTDVNSPMETSKYHSKVLGNIGIEVFGVKREFQFSVYSGFEVDELGQMLKSRTYGPEIRREIVSAIYAAAHTNVQIKYIDLNGKKIKLT